ncbi:hypothetical protein SFR_1434 [Streptomyces sp. FR-008]|nr:hypothetical protein SFR_1434 [Streptomyces sp. FR-008]
MAPVGAHLVRLHAARVRLLAVHHFARHVVPAHPSRVRAGAERSVRWAAAPGQRGPGLAGSPAWSRFPSVRAGAP